MIFLFNLNVILFIKNCLWISFFQIISINLGNNIKLKEIEGGRAWSKINKIFKGYLKDDIALALDFANREKLTDFATLSL